MVANGTSEPKLSAFPVFMRVEGRKVHVFGGGEEALAKARLLSQSSADLAVVADDPEPELSRWARRNGVEIVGTAAGEASLRDAALVFAATGDPSRDAEIVAAARAARVPVNSVDQPALCDFYTPALVNRAPVAVAIGTEGAGPVLAQMIRARIDGMLPPWLGRLAELASAWRAPVETHVPKGARRRAFWHAFFGGAPARAVEEGDAAAARAAASSLLANAGGPPAGHVALVGAGPGAEDLLTLRAQRLLMEADVIVHDALVPDAIVAMGRRDARRVAAGKRKGCHAKSQREINDLLVRLAREGRQVVRLKSGDPLVFGRAGEEMAALREAGISFEVVPGVTSALAAAADFHLPLTLRGVSSSLVLTTGHDLRGAPIPDWAKLAIDGATVAVYMGRSNAGDVAARLIDAGLAADTAVAVVEHASLARRRRFHGTLADLPSLRNRADLDGPVMTIIGDAVAGGSFDNSTALADGGAVLPARIGEMAVQ